MIAGADLRTKTWMADLVVAWLAVTGVAAATIYLATEHYRVVLVGMLAVVDVAGVVVARALGKRMATRSRKVGFLSPMLRLAGMVAWLSGAVSLVAVASEDTAPDHHDGPLDAAPVPQKPLLPPNVIPLEFENGAPIGGAREIGVRRGETVRIKTKATQLLGYRIVSRRRTCGKTLSTQLLGFDCTLMKGLIPRLLFVDPSAALTLAVDQPYEVHSDGTIVVMSMQVAANACSAGPITVEDKRALGAVISPCPDATPVDVDSVVATENHFSIELEVTRQLYPSESP